jgi:hypothetical protein
MNSILLLYLAAGIVFAWGVAHLFPTRSVVRGFGAISPDNTRIITMEWIIEGITLIFVGVLLATVTFVDPACIVSKSVYWITFGLLNLISLISTFTGFRNSFIAFKLCPFIFTGSSLMILAGGLLF